MSWQIEMEVYITRTQRKIDSDLVRSLRYTGPRRQPGQSRWAYPDILSGDFVDQ